ncbi:MAG TPA: hypothetical protein VL088_14690 [Pedobacter sp.]|nr:hypothetical protein [Pedobacter sp.]
MRKNSILLILLLSLPFVGFSQQASLPTQNTAKSKDLIIDTAGKKHPMSVQLQLGTSGLGASFRYGIKPRLTARMGINSIFGVKVDNAFQFSGFDADNELTSEVINLNILGEYLPFKGKSFRIVGGVAYLVKADGGIKFFPREGYDFNGLVLTKEEVGNLDINLSWKGIAPYLGIGLFNSIPNKLFSVNVDIGAYYLNQPKSTVTGTNLLSDNKSIEPQLDKNMSSYRFFPVLQVNFNFNIHKFKKA